MRKRTPMVLLLRQVSLFKKLKKLKKLTLQKNQARKQNKLRIPRQ